MKQTNLSAAPGTHTDRSAASCPRMDATGGGTGSQLIPGVRRTTETRLATEIHLTEVARGERSLIEPGVSRRLQVRKGCAAAV